jgi:hypothetical protein
MITGIIVKKGIRPKPVSKIFTDDAAAFSWNQEHKRRYLPCTG